MIDKQQRALEAVLTRASFDKDFREQLLTLPKQALEQAFGLHIPSHFRIRFVERDPDLDALIVLPDFLSHEGEAELDDHELERASGGAGEPDPGPAWGPEPDPQDQ